MNCATKKFFQIKLNHSKLNLIFLNIRFRFISSTIKVSQFSNLILKSYDKIILKSTSITPVLVHQIKFLKLIKSRGTSIERFKEREVTWVVFNYQDTIMPQRSHWLMTFCCTVGCGLNCSIKKFNLSKKVGNHDANLIFSIFFSVRLSVAFGTHHKRSTFKLK